MHSTKSSKIHMETSIPHKFQHFLAEGKEIKSAAMIRLQPGSQLYTVPGWWSSRHVTNESESLYLVFGVNHLRSCFNHHEKCSHCLDDHLFSPLTCITNHGWGVRDASSHQNGGIISIQFLQPLQKTIFEGLRIPMYKDSFQLFSWDYLMFFPRRWCWSLAFACWLSPQPFLPYAFGQAVSLCVNGSIAFLTCLIRWSLGRPSHLSCLAEWQASMHHACHGNGKLRWSLCSITFALMWHLGLQQVNVNSLPSKWAKDPPKTIQNRKHLELVLDGLLGEVFTPMGGLCVFRFWRVQEPFCLVLKSSGTFCRDRNSLLSQCLTNLNSWGLHMW